MSPANFECGSGISWADPQIESARLYGVVIDNKNDEISIVEVRQARAGTKCYDEGGADPVRDKDNVRLRSCPPPFTDLCLLSGGHGCFAFADLSSMVRFSETEIMLLGVSVEDDGSKITDKERRDIIDHLWRDEKQISKTAAPAEGAMARMMRLCGAPERETDADQGPSFDF